MNTLEAISSRRSIRRWQQRPVPRATIGRLLEAASLAPSAKNGQPWRFVVVEGQARDELVDIMLQQAEALKGWGVDIGSLEWTARSMATAPVSILVLHEALPPEVPAEAKADYDFVMLQSTGGAIQTLLLAATEEGLGSLWICDVLYARCEILEWLGRPDRMLVAAVTLGYPAEAPRPRPRRPWSELTEWRS